MTDPKKTVDEAQEMAWNTKLTEIRKLLSEQTADELARRHQIGVAVLEMKRDLDKYGKGAVERLAEDLGFDKSTLYEYATVTETWPAKAFKELCGRKTTKGMPITFSHLLELTNVKNAKRRAALLEQVFTKSLSVRALREKISGHGAKVSKKVRSNRATNPRTFAALFNEMDVAIVTLADWKTSLPEMCNAASATDIANTKKKLEIQRAVLEKMITILESTAEQHVDVATEAVPTSPLSRRPNGQPEVSP